MSRRHQRGPITDPLTRDRAKPAVPFGGMYRIVDFALSNCINSQLFNILALTQYKSLSLEHHIAQGWGRFFHAEFGQWLTVASLQQRVSEDWYRGTADAVYQNLYSVEKSGSEHVLVLAADLPGNSVKDGHLAADCDPNDPISV